MNIRINGMKAYMDILYLPHPTPVRHSPMNRHERAAQFAPFAALNGFDETIQEAETSFAMDAADGGLRYVMEYAGA